MLAVTSPAFVQMLDIKSSLVLQGLRWLPSIDSCPSISVFYGMTCLLIGRNRMFKLHLFLYRYDLLGPGRFRSVIYLDVELSISTEFSNSIPVFT